MGGIDGIDGIDECNSLMGVRREEDKNWEEKITVVNKKALILVYLIFFSLSFLQTSRASFVLLWGSVSIHQVRVSNPTTQTTQQQESKEKKNNNSTTNKASNNKLVLE